MGDKKGASLARMRLSLFCNLEKLRFQSVASDKFQRKIQIPMRLSGHSPPQAGGIMVAPPRRIRVNLKGIDFKGGGGRLCRIPPAEAGGKFKYSPQTQAPKINYTSPQPASWVGGR
jgi:hypothetical protein